MIQKIIIVPDDRLTTVCKPVAAFDKSLDKLVEDLFETLYAADGLGMAAPQVGVLLNVFVIDVRKGKKPHNPMAFINPSVLCTTLETLTEVEGCLSIPGVFLPVTRPARVGFRSRGVRGEYIHGDLRGMEARCFQHELSHTRGVLFTSEADEATASPER
jgi:peptide deformylase